MALPASAAASVILSQPKFGNGVGFRRTRALLEPLLDSPWGRRFTTIRVTGSNGKGSVTALTHSILRALGVNCGRFTSPHLVRFNERIVLGDAEITDEALDHAYAWVKGDVPRVYDRYPGDAFGAFELATAVCIRAFFEAGVDVAVVEAGIGGRLDTTRLLPGRLVALTSLDLEHTELLGRTLELIGYDKLDLCPDGGCVVTPRFDDDLASRLRAYATVRGVELIDASAFCKVEHRGVSLDGPRPLMHVGIETARVSCEAAVPLVGPHQVENLAVAVSLADRWTAGFRPEVSRAELSAAVVAGLAGVDWPGRFQRVSTDPPVFIDVGHSPGACRRLAETVRGCLGGDSILLVTGVSSNKAVEEILDVLVPLASGVLCTRAYHHGERVERIAELARARAGDGVPTWEAPTIEEAVRLSRDLAAARGMTVLVAGGLFLAVEFHVAWSGGDPQGLQFL